MSKEDAMPNEPMNAEEIARDLAIEKRLAILEAVGSDGTTTATDLLALDVRHLRAQRDRALALWPEVKRLQQQSDDWRHAQYTTARERVELKERIAALEEALGWAMAHLGRKAGPYYEAGYHKFSCLACLSKPGYKKEDVQHTSDCPWARANALLKKEA